MNRTLFFTFFLLFLIFCSNVSARSDDYSFFDIKVAIVDSDGMVEGFDQSYLIGDNSFILVNNLQVIRVLYTKGNVTIEDDKSMSRMLWLDLENGARLRVYDVQDNNSLLFDGWTYEKSFANFLDYGSGKYFNSGIILAPVTVGFSLLISYSLLSIHKRRIL